MVKRKKAGKTVKVGGTQTIKPTKAGQKPLKFKKGGLHASLGVPQGKKIPSGKMSAALSGKYGPLAKKRASFAKNVLSKGRKTASRGR